MELWQIKLLGLLVSVAFIALANQCSEDNATYNDGDIYTLDASGPCVKYRCDGGSRKIHSLQCRDGQECKDQGTNKSELNGCRITQCQFANQTIGFVPIVNGCHDGEKCIDADTSSTVDCRTGFCGKHNVSNAFGYFFTAIKCKDVDDNCHDPGTTFSAKNKAGQVMNSCTCTASINSFTNTANISYTCS